MPSNRRKRDARRIQYDHGVSYTEALRLASAADQPLMVPIGTAADGRHVHLEVAAPGLPPVALIAGTPGCGKTVLAHTVAWHTAEAGRPVAYIANSPDADIDRVTARLAAHPNVATVLAPYADSDVVADATVAAIGRLAGTGGVVIVDDLAASGPLSGPAADRLERAVREARSLRVTLVAVTQVAEALPRPVKDHVGQSVLLCHLGGGNEAGALDVAGRPDLPEGALRDLGARRNDDGTVTGPSGWLVRGGFRPVRCAIVPHRNALEVVAPGQHPNARRRA